MHKWYRCQLEEVFNRKGSERTRAECKGVCRLLKLMVTISFRNFPLIRWRQRKEKAHSPSVKYYLEMWKVSSTMYVITINVQKTVPGVHFIDCLEFSIDTHMYCSVYCSVYDFWWAYSTHLYAPSSCSIGVLPPVVLEGGGAWGWRYHGETERDELWTDGLLYAVHRVTWYHCGMCV